MPSKDSHPAAADVEDLVAAIKEKLRLKTRSCHALYPKQNRTSPYKVPTSVGKNRTAAVFKNTNGDDANVTHVNSPRTCRQCFLDLDREPQQTAAWPSLCMICAQRSAHLTRRTDPYDVLQELLRQGTLIQEAVKRLQLHKRTTAAAKLTTTSYYEEDVDNFDEVSSTASSTTPYEL